MTERQPPEKRTVEQTDELLRKSRRLIDELEFILEKLDRDPQRLNEEKGRNQSGQRGDSARSE